MAKKAFYSIGDQEFPTKDEVTDRCRQIIRSTPDGKSVSIEDLGFLLNLFQYHEGWTEKLSKGIKDIIVEPSGQYSTRAFVLIRNDDSKMDISFTHVIKLLRSERTRTLLPQALVDYKNAARSAVTEDIRDFRDSYLALNLPCPFSGELIVRENCEVDHEPPKTFDKLLYDFTIDQNIDPLRTRVGSKDGIIPYFEDEQLASQWIDYHRANAKLRLLSIIGHKQVRSVRIDWSLLIR